MGFLRKYHDALRHQHGWEVELTCPECGHTAVPHYGDWEFTRTAHLGDTPTVFALVTCPNCGRDLRGAAGDCLVATFSDVAVPQGNKRLVVYFAMAVTVITTVPIAVQLALKPGFHVASFGAILVMPLIFTFNYAVAATRRRCPCGQPRYIFMGLLGRSYCYRCATCGRLLRLRD